jgi:hypothetical protein
MINVTTSLVKLQCTMQVPTTSRDIVSSKKALLLACRRLASVFLHGFSYMDVSVCLGSFNAVQAH